MSLSALQSPDLSTSRQRVRRFEPIERFAHWWTAFWFAMTALSGTALGDDSGSTMTPTMLWHLISAGSLVVGLVLLPVLPGRQALWATLRQLLIFRIADRQALRTPAALLPGAHGAGSPRWGKFNTGQKLAAYTLAALIAAIYLSGLAAFASGGDGGMHGSFVALALLVLAAHVFLAILNPTTRPALRGMLTGWVDRSWAELHHPAWVDEVDRNPPGRIKES